MRSSIPDLDFSGAPRVSPLHDFWAARMVVNQWRLVAGMTLPDVITCFANETAALAGRAGFGDISARMVLHASGPELRSYLDKVFAGSPPPPKPGQGSRAIWAQSAGEVRGAGRLFWTTESSVLLTSEVWDFGWFFDSARGFDVDVSIASNAQTGLRIVGPDARFCLDAAGGSIESGVWVAPGLGAVYADETSPNCIDLWCGYGQSVGLAALLMGCGAEPVGQAALEAWRIQAGLLRPFQDWTPFQAARDWSVVRRLSDFSAATTGFVLAQAIAEAPDSGVWTSTAPWPAKGARFALGWSEVGKPLKNPSEAIILRAATTD